MRRKITALLLILVLMLSTLTACIKWPWPPKKQPEGGVMVTDGHVDLDNSGYCDDCGEYVIVYLDFYVINDLHGKLTDTEDNPGVDELSTYIKTMMSLDDNAVLLSSGDMWQGSSESNLTYGLMMTDWMNYMDFDAMTLGNHEYDWGEEYIIANGNVAEFPTLAINIFEKDTNERVEYCDASVVVERNGLKIGIIGAIGDCYSSISADMSGDVYFKTGSAMTELIKAESDRLRKDEGVDFVALSLHDGYDKNRASMSAISNSDLRAYYDISLSRGYVDVVFEGHTHKSYMLSDNEGVFHLQAGGENKAISHIEFQVNFANGNKKVTNVEIVESDVYDDFADDSIIFELTEKYSDEISKANEVLGTLSRNVYSTEICELVAKLYYQKGVEIWGDRYKIALGGGFLSLRNPYELGRGEVTYSDVYSILPFDNQLVLCSTTGKNLLRVFIETNNDRYHVYRDSTIISSIDPTATYYVVTDTYTSTYSYNNLTEVERYKKGVYARDLLADYIKSGGLK